MCSEPMWGMCEECGVFFEKQEYIVSDFRNFQKIVSFPLSTGTISRKMAHKNETKNRQNEFSIRYRVQS